MGPFELMDMIGIDVNLAVTQSVYEQFFNDPRYRPHPIQRQNGGFWEARQEKRKRVLQLLKIVFASKKSSFSVHRWR